MKTREKYLNVAIESAKESGGIFKKFFGKPQKVEIKNRNPGDLVTATDKKIELLIRKKIHKNFPAHKIIGEEFQKDKIGKKDLIWLIDPIDGTTNYIQGIPFCCVSIGLWDSLGPLVAVVFNPVLNQLYSAVRSGGSKLNGRKIRVGDAGNLSTAMGALGWGKEKAKAISLFSKFIKRCFKIRILATGAWQMCMVASGNVDFYASINENIWDFGAAALIVKEAGGKVTDIKGKNISLKTNSIIASNGRIHNQILDKLKDRG